MGVIPKTFLPNYKEFYEKVAMAKFIANGREVEGFKNPDDLIRAQQMLHGYSDKMRVFKEYKPFIKTLEERGFTADPEKFKQLMLAEGSKMKDRVDVIVLCQGSMAFGEQLLHDTLKLTVLSSPRFGAAELKRALQRKGIIESL